MCGRGERERRAEKEERGEGEGIGRGKKGWKTLSSRFLRRDYSVNSELARQTMRVLWISHRLRPHSVSRCNEVFRGMWKKLRNQSRVREGPPSWILS